MQRVTAPADDLPLFDVAAVRRIEQLALAGVPPYTLMRRAGEALAHLALALAPHAQRVRVAAGPGNNGGDGLEAAAVLQGWGKAVEVRLLASPDRLTGDARTAHARAAAAGVRFTTADSPRDGGLTPQDLAIDALLGIGASRPPEGELARAIVALNQLPCPVLAADVPSGLNADTGQPLGSACVRAQHTLTMLTLKPGLFTGAGRDQAGTVWLDTLGVALPVTEPSVWLVGSAAQRSPTRLHATHKGSFGDVVVIGGAPGMVGAALLAARAAHAAGAGRVFVQLLDASAPTVDSGRPELMLRPGWVEHANAETWAASTVVCGCGGGDALRELLPRVISRAARLVLDADALNAIAMDSMLLNLLQQRAARGLATVLTPHPLEAARLLDVDSHGVQADRLAAARALAERCRCIVVLKGSGTVIASPDGVPRMNPSGNAALASAGTGDVLAGWLGGEWAQHRGPSATGGAIGAALRSVWLHGHAADHAGVRVMRASRLIETMFDLSAG